MEINPGRGYYSWTVNAESPGKLSANIDDGPRISVSKTSSAIEYLCLAVVWGIYAFLVFRFWFVTDDAFISFRYAHNWVSGEGIRFNLGDQPPVEGYSNFLWVAVSALILLIGADIKFWPLVISFACGSILLCYVFIILRRRFELPLPVSILAILPLGCSPAFALWSTTGLESMPFALFMFAAFERLIIRKNGPAPVAAGILGFLLALTRVEGIYWAVVFAPLAIASGLLKKKIQWRSILIYFAILLAGYAVYWLWRYSYYGAIHPNTVYAKVSISAETLKRGFNYVLVQHMTFLSMLLFIPGALFALRRDRIAVGLPVAAMAVGVVMYAIIVGGDYMPMARILVPGITFSAILTGWMLADMYRGSMIRKTCVVAAVILFVVAGVLPAWNIHLVPEPTRAKHHFRLNAPGYQSEYVFWELEKERVGKWKIVGLALKEYADPSDSVVWGSIGAIGYYSELFIYDPYGLVDPDVRNRKTGRLKSAGHDKLIDFTHFLDKKPTYIWAQLLVESGMVKFTDRWHKSYTSRNYVADFVLLEDVSGYDEPVYLAVVRRLKKGENSAAAWNKTEGLLRSIGVK